MQSIDVEPLGQDGFRVTVTDDRSATDHRVTAAPDDLARLGAGAEPAQVIEASFRFLLDREPKEAILRSFELSVISSYFPEYESELRRYL